MTQTTQASDLQSEIGQPTLSTLYAEFFNGPYEQCQRAAISFARRAGRGLDKAFVDECQAEAYFLIVELIWSSYNGLMGAYPDEAERHKTYRCFVGYKLKEYWSQRSTSTVSYLKKKGIEVKYYTLSNCEELETMEHPSLAKMDISVDLYILLDSVCQNDVERQVVDLYATGRTKEEIGEILEIPSNRAKKILRRVKRRIRNQGEL